MKQWDIKGTPKEVSKEVSKVSGSLQVIKHAGTGLVK